MYPEISTVGNDEERIVMTGNWRVTERWRRSRACNTRMCKVGVSLPSIERVLIEGN